MSQCKRGCVFSITAEDCLLTSLEIWIQVKENYVNELLNLISIYSLAEEVS